MGKVLQLLSEIVVHEFNDTTLAVRGTAGVCEIPVCCRGTNAELILGITFLSAADIFGKCTDWWEMLEIAGLDTTEEQIHVVIEFTVEVMLVEVARLLVVGTVTIFRRALDSEQFVNRSLSGAGNPSTTTGDVLGNASNGEACDNEPVDGDRLELGFRTYLPKFTLISSFKASKYCRSICLMLSTVSW